MGYGVKFSLKIVTVEIIICSRFYRLTIGLEKTVANTHQMHNLYQVIHNGFNQNVIGALIWTCKFLVTMGRLAGFEIKMGSYHYLT